VVFHSFAISVSTFPAQWLSPKVSQFTGYYTGHVFTQNWRLFVPCPLLNSRLEVNYFFDGDSTGWVRPMQRANDIHAITRVTHYAELSLAEANLLYYIDADLVEMKIPLNQEWTREQTVLYRNGQSAFMLRNFVNGTCTYLYETKMDSAYVRCTFENVAEDSVRIVNLPNVVW
jgi:hypothetical protein